MMQTYNFQFCFILADLNLALMKTKIFDSPDFLTQHVVENPSLDRKQQLNKF